MELQIVGIESAHIKNAITDEVVMTILPLENSTMEEVIVVDEGKFKAITGGEDGEGGENGRI